MRRVMKTDLDGAFWCLREAARAMRPAGGGSIVLIAFDRGVQPEPPGALLGRQGGGHPPDWTTTSGGGSAFT